ncbi:MAG: carbohydrate kinase family protein [Vicinamibacterales bacterium]
MALRLLVIGDVAWDIFIRPEGDLVRGSDVVGTVDVMPGGAAANVAVWARRLGADVTLVGKIGDDTLGTLMHAHLRSEGVGRHVITVPGGVSTRVGILVAADGEHSFVIDHTKVLRFEEGDAPPTLLDAADAVFFNGYDIFLARSTAFLAALLADARRRRIPVLFDPSSFALIEAFGAGRLMESVGPVDVLLANDAEAGALCEGRPLAALEAYAALAVVKQGPRGASAYASGAAWHVPANPVQVVDTTGAGDAFDAAFIVEWLSSRDVETALTAGNRLGAHVAAHLGAQPPAPT